MVEELFRTGWIGIERYHEEILPYLDSIKKTEHPIGGGRYGLVIRTEKNEIIYVLPGQVASSSPSRLTILCENPSEETKEKIEELLR